MTRTIAPVMVVVLSLLMAACGDTSDLEARINDLELRIATLESVEETDGEPANLTGAVVIIDASNYRTVEGAECTGSGEKYRDIKEGTAITARDADGRTVVQDELGRGILDVTSGSTECRFPYFLAGLPTELDYYDIEIVGRTSRFYQSELDAGGWRLKLVVDASN